MSNPPRFDVWTCPLPLRDHTTITLAHGAGGRLSAELVEHLLLPAFRNETLEILGDSAVLPAATARLAVTTDSFVVRPLYFPGGSIGELAVNGTINDLAMSGAIPKYLTVAFVLEEGWPIAEFAQAVERLAMAARNAGVQVVAGDTKVVERGRCEGCYITTTGIGFVSNDVELGPHLARPGDAILLNGTLGDHGIAVLSQRESLGFQAEIASDTAPLHEIVREVLAVAPETRVLRDATRGGLAAVLNEIAARSNVGIVLDESSIPVRPAVQTACELLGFDVLTVANEGKFVAIVPSSLADATLAAMRRHPLGVNAAIIGRVNSEHPRIVAVQTAFGSTRIVPMPAGELLPRIC